MKVVNEGSESYVDYSVLDEDMELATPTALRYRIDCLTNRETIQDWTTISTLTAQGTITVSASQNAILDQCNRRERRQMIVETTYGTSVRNDNVDWLVKNFFGVS